MTYKRKEQIGDCEIMGFPKNAYIYSIEGSDVVYIGSTTQPIKNRIRNHIADAKNGSDLPIHIWMKERKFSFKVNFLEIAPEEMREEREKFWVSSFPNLLNVTNGGRGMSGHKFAGTEHAKKIAAKLITGKHFDCLCCGKKFWRKNSEILKCHNKYCSRKCSNGRNKI